MTTIVASRTQAQRRTETITRLINATIEILAEHGYSKLTTNAICERAGRSQGALFRHFSTRAELIARATEEMSLRHVAEFMAAMASSSGPLNPEQAVRLLFDLSRTKTHTAWREVVVAARTDSMLRERLREPVQRFLQSIEGVLPTLLGLEPGPETRPLGVLALSLAHAFDSEALAASIYSNPKSETERLAWAASLITRELEALEAARS